MVFRAGEGAATFMHAVASSAELVGEDSVT
jgi:hypothetical protein